MLIQQEKTKSMIGGQRLPCGRNDGQLYPWYSHLVLFLLFFSCSSLRVQTAYFSWVNDEYLCVRVMLSLGSICHEPMATCVIHFPLSYWKWGLVKWSKMTARRRLSDLVLLLLAELVGLTLELQAADSSFTFCDLWERTDQLQWTPKGRGSSIPRKKIFFQKQPPAMMSQ